jgi:hypothetical protein
MSNICEHEPASGGSIAEGATVDEIVDKQGALMRN